MDTPLTSAKPTQFFPGSQNRPKTQGKKNGSKPSLRREAWESLGDPTATNIMTRGLRLFFHTPPPLSLLPPSLALPSPSQLPFIRPFIPVLLSRRIIRRITSPQLLFFSRLFVVKKKEGSNRLIIDLSLLNKLLIVPSFKMETYSKIAKGLVGPLWGCTIDLEDAYFHVPMDWLFHKFLAFVVDGQVFVFQMLPFGLSVAPWTFSRVVKPIKSHLHRMAILISSYLDDFLLLHHTQTGLQESLSVVLALFDSLGIWVNYPKSHLQPSQRVEYLGVLFLLDSMELTLPESKVLSISSRCREILQQPCLPRRALESLLGSLNFASGLVPLGRLRLLPLISWVNSHTSPSSRDLPVPLDGGFRSALQVWGDVSFLQSPVPMSVPPPDIQLMTDASRFGWSGAILPDRVMGQWPPDYQLMSTNWLELKAVLLSLEHFLPRVRGQNVLMTDNTTVVSCLRRQGSLRSDPLMSLSKEILELCLSHSTTLVPKHLCGRLNVFADQGSRLDPVSTEWALDRKTFLWLSSEMGPFQLDLFATRFNAQVSSFVSPFPDEMAAGVNALSLHWDEWDCLYLFPPTPLLQEVVARLHGYRGRGVLVAPFFPQSSWFPSLRRASSYLPLPRGHSLSQTTSRGLVFHPNVSLFKLHAWKL